MERLAVLVGRSNEAREEVAGLRKRLMAVGERLPQDGEGRPMFFEVRAEPLTAAARGSIAQQILVAAGAENVIKSEKGIVQSNSEALPVADCDLYLV